MFVYGLGNPEPLYMGLLLTFSDHLTTYHHRNPEDSSETKNHNQHTSHNISFKKKPNPLSGKKSCLPHFAYVIVYSSEIQLCSRIALVIHI